MERSRSAPSATGSNRQGFFTARRAIVPSRGVALLVAGWTFVTVAGRAHALIGHPASTGALLFTGGVVLASLTAIAVGCASAIEAAESPRRYVFHSRPTFRTAVILLLGSAAIVARLVIHRPFDSLFSYGELTAITVADAGAILAAVASFVGCGVAAFAWWDAHRDERTWSRPFVG